jgi:hypothetical protein
MDVVSHGGSISMDVKALLIYQHWVTDVVSYRRSVSLIVDASPTLGYQHYVVGVVSCRRSISLDVIAS